MKEKDYYFIFYEGNHTGKEYSNDVVGVAETKCDAEKIIDEMIDQDKETYPCMTYEGHEFHDDERSLHGKYFIRKRTVYIV